MYLGPTDRWPAHSRPQARAALEEARAAGWWFRPSGGHTFGRLRCVPPERDLEQEACVVPVYSTSGTADGSDTARVIRDAVRKCPHERDFGTDGGAHPEGAARLAAGKLAQIAGLVEAAEGLLAKEAADREADDVIEDALRRLAHDIDSPIDGLDERATELERLASLESGRAYAAASRVGAADPWPPRDGARELLQLARAGFKDAVDLVAAAGGSDDEGRVAAERDRLADRLERLSSLLGQGP
jgi:hypothetical protein